MGYWHVCCIEQKHTSSTGGTGHERVSPFCLVELFCRRARRICMEPACFSAAPPPLAGTPLPSAQPGDASLILVAKPALRDNLYGATILVAKPMSNDRHIGFIVNKPTRVTLGKLFPDHQP